MAPLVLNFGTTKDSFRLWPVYPLEEALVPCHYETEWDSAGLDAVKNGKCLVPAVNRTTIPRSPSP